MPRETKRDKALRYLAEDRVTVVAAAPQGVRLLVRGSRAEPYVVRLWRTRDGLLTQCSCYNGSAVHPVRPTCSHLEIARMLWRE